MNSKSEIADSDRQMGNRHEIKWKCTKMDQ